jgi:hypothetical protein
MMAVHVLSNAAPDGIVPPVCGPRARHMTVSNFILDNPEHWLQRAEEARAQHRRRAVGSGIEATVLRITEDYERLANHASRRKKGRMAQAETHRSLSSVGWL